MSSKLPPAFIRSLRDNYQLEEESFLKSLSNSSPVTSIRLNPYKPASIYNSAERVLWCDQGRYLSERPFFTADPLFHAGCYYVQEASSMFLEHVLKNSLDLNKKLTVLDLCAAPGGKSTLISSLLTAQSLLVANEIIKTRVPILADNLSKWGKENVFVSNNDPRDFQKLTGLFDAVVIDAPCSGSGMWRKDPDSINEWSESAVQLCSQRQKRILADIYPSINKDGILIYSTCSYSKEENEEISDWLCENFDLSSIRIPVAEDWGIIETLSEKQKCHGYRFYPHKVRGEGFFIACFKKNDSTGNSEVKNPRKNIQSSKEEELLKMWINSDPDISIKLINDSYFAIRTEHIGYLHLLQSKLYLKKSGVRLGKIMGKDLIPDHELALSLLLNPGVKKINIDRDQALTYLKRNEIKIETDYIGWAVICYQDKALGWAKILHNRINNYYPKELRIVNQNIT
ncbi:methyltransferase RsmF C-terminal domain-like protein [Daejeonella oryzae]|uniref:methyltransferase RsmF C-terminal domain-like protein n=1 Tax=Daejeonella oryzae TaxID=1122943 RepID=UPI0003FEDACE|nr:hypothetical protein [Daejeonella oryzae]